MQNPNPQLIDGRWTEQQIRDAFDLVTRHMTDWRAPIDTEMLCHGDEEELLDAAIMFFTATRATFTPMGSADGGTVYRIQADGYRAGPAGP